MADPTPDPTRLLEVKKYPNRRLYDATRSCHVTLGELYDLVAAGHMVRVRDSKSGEDITNQVLLQALIERDPLKVTAVPSPLIHMMIRMNQNLIASWFDQYVGQFMEAYRAASGQGGPNPWWGWPGAGAGWPGAAGGAGFRGWPPTGAPAGAPPSPLEWMASFMRPPGPTSPASAPPDEHAGPEDEPVGDEPAPVDPGGAGRDDDIESLRRQIAEIASEMARLRATRDDEGDEPADR